jgi:kynureninase
MATGDEVRKSFASDANTYSVGITARTIGGNAAQVLSTHITNKKIDALSSAHLSGASSATTGSLATIGTAVDVGNSITVAVYGRFSAASAWCEIALALYDEANTLIGVTEKKVITGDSSWTDGTKYLAPRVLFDVGEASKVKCVLKQGVSSGTADVYIEVL